MTYEEFKGEIMPRIKGILMDDSIVTIEKVNKNNDSIYDAVVIKEPGMNVIPTIYLNYYYNPNVDYDELDVIAHDIIKCFEQHKNISQDDYSWVMDYESISDNVKIKLVNRASNKQLLKNIPYVSFLDLAVCFYVTTQVTKEGGSNEGTILVNNELFAAWSVELEELYEKAIKNTQREYGPYFIHLAELLEEQGQIPERMDECSKEIFPVYVLSNDIRLYGASVILYDDVIKTIADGFEGNLLIIPCSIHEVLILPEYYEMDIEMLNEQIKYVNCMELHPSDVLSDHVYIYDKAAGKITF